MYQYDRISDFFVILVKGSRMLLRSNNLSPMKPGEKRDFNVDFVKYPSCPMKDEDVKYYFIEKVSTSSSISKL